MPAVRLSRRRRSSLAISFSPAKPGFYGINSPSPRPFTFAPNVTPGTFVDPDSPSSFSSIDQQQPASPSTTLFPPSDLPPPAPSRRRAPPGKRRSLGYIPRPPNAFMLFRADFVRQKHVPGSIETNHGSLSKIIGNCWKSLPLEEKRVWEVKAKHAKAEHKIRYPEYRFRPVHNKNKDRKKEKPAPSPADERRCEEVAQLLLEGKKGDELAAAVRSLDSQRDDTDVPYTVPSHPPHPALGHRRSSSVPLPNCHPGIALPSLPFLSNSRPSSPISNIARGNRHLLGSRRASSAHPAQTRSWTHPIPLHLQRDHSPLPAVDTSIFEPSFFDPTAGFPFSANDSPPFNFHDVLASLPPPPHQVVDLSLGPLDPLVQAPLPQCQLYNTISHPHLQAYSHSQTPSAYSGSPAHSEQALPQLAAPQPLAPAHMQPRLSALWKDFSTFDHQMPAGAGGMGGAGNGMGMGIGFDEAGMTMFAQVGYDMGMDMGAGMGMGMGQFQPELESLLEQNYCSGGGGGGGAHDPSMAFGFEFNDLVHE